MQLKRIQGIDGLKAIAILAITFYHFFPSIVKGGYLGVCLFFILSGFLISLKPPFLYGPMQKNELNGSIQDCC